MTTRPGFSVSADGNTMIIGPGVEADFFRHTVDPPVGVPATDVLALVYSETAATAGQFVTRALPATAVGDVVGPASDPINVNAIVTFNGNTGKLLQANDITITGGAMVFGASTDDIDGLTTINDLNVPSASASADTIVTSLAAATGDSVARFNTTGATIQESNVSIDSSGVMTIAAVAATAGLILPNVIGIAPETSSLFDTYQRQTVATTFSGPWADQNATLLVERIGNRVFIHGDFAPVLQTVASQLIGSAVGAVPSFARPTGNRRGLLAIIDNTVAATGATVGGWQVSSAGTITISAGPSLNTTFAAVAADVTGIDPGWQISYQCNPAT